MPGVQHSAPDGAASERTMAAAPRDDVNVVRVYPSNMEMVGGEDVEEWLAHLGPVSQVKLQYDPVRRVSCYAVRFKDASSARMAVEYLDAATLRNCEMTITSTVFTKNRVSAPEADRGSADAEGASPAESASAYEWECGDHHEALPHNHLVRPDLRMDALLVPVVRELGEREPECYADAAELREELAAQQQAFVELVDHLRVQAKRAREMDEKVRKHLADLDDLRSDAAKRPRAERGDGARTTPAVDHRRSHRIRSMGSLDAKSLALDAALEKLSRAVGPISKFAVVYASGAGRLSSAYQLVVEFFDPQDAALALRLLMDRSTAAPGGAKKTTNDRRTEGHLRGILEALRVCEWEGDAATTCGMIVLPQEFRSAHSAALRFLQDHLPSE